MVNLNQMYEHGNLWHAISKALKDVLFCEYQGLFVEHMRSGAFSKEQWESKFGYKFIAILPSDITWEEYIEDYHNKELAKFKNLSLEDMCARLRKIYVDCESNIKDFNTNARYSEFRKISNNTIGIRHGKSSNNTRPATEMECINAFKEYQKFTK